MHTFFSFYVILLATYKIRYLFYSGGGLIVEIMKDILVVSVKI